MRTYIPELGTARVAPVVHDSDVGFDAADEAGPLYRVEGAKWVASQVVMSSAELARSTAKGMALFSFIILAAYMLACCIAILPYVLPFGSSRHLGAELTLETVTAASILTSTLRHCVLGACVFFAGYRHRPWLIMTGFWLPYFCCHMIPQMALFWLYRFGSMPQLPYLNISTQTIPILACSATLRVCGDKRYWIAIGMLVLSAQTVCYIALLDYSRATPSDSMRLLIRLLVFPVLAIMFETLTMATVKLSLVRDPKTRMLESWPGAGEVDLGNAMIFLASSGFTAIYSRLLIASSSTLGLTVLTILAVGVIGVMTRLTAAWRWELVLRFRALDFWKRRLSPNMWEMFGCKNPVLSHWDKYVFALEYIFDVANEALFILVVPTVQAVSWYWARYSITAPAFYDWEGWQLVVTTMIAVVVQLAVYATVRVYYVRGGFDWEGLLRQMYRPHLILSTFLCLAPWITLWYSTSLMFWEYNSHGLSDFCVRVDDAALRNSTETATPGWTVSGSSVYSNWTVVPPLGFPVASQVENWIFNASTTAEAVYRISSYCGATTISTTWMFQAFDYGRREAFCCAGVGFGVHMAGQTVRIVP